MLCGATAMCNVYCLPLTYAGGAVLQQSKKISLICNLQQVPSPSYTITEG